MSLIKYNPSHARSLAFNSLFDNFFNNNFSSPDSAKSNSFVPQVDIAETDSFFELQFVISGVDKKGFNIELQDGKITVSGERKVENDKDEKNYHSRESYYGSFKRSFYLPDNINEEKVEAKYTDGILSIVIPKDEKRITKKSIEVK
ncbi:MAG: Hsp20/alpha crystallin family protein [Cyclobacteriaceae bacterium]|nr:Hsp20/alpha crystallin family protein [Cyclobacteriaceae bacterium]